MPPLIWGGAGDCDHEWGSVLVKKSTGGPAESQGLEGGKATTQEGARFTTTSQYCQLCGAWKGSLGLEDSPDLYIQHLVDIFRKCKRVLSDSGTLILNLGDSYAGSWGNSGHRVQLDGGESCQRERKTGYWQRPGYDDHRTTPATATPKAYGLKPKDLIGIPWRVALALQADGWYLRSAMPWIKRSAMPESVTDRPTTAHEYIFLLSKEKRYFWDQEGVRRIQKPESEARYKSGFMNTEKHQSGGYSANGQKHTPGIKEYNPQGRNLRTSDFFFDSLDDLITQQRAYLAHLESVRDGQELMVDEEGDPLALTVNTKGFSGAHFACFPPRLAEVLLKASTSRRGVCPVCFAPWERVTEKGFTAHTGKTESAYQNGTTANRLALLRQAARENGSEYVNQRKTTGWRPTCTHNAEPIPPTCFDPFWGAGTTSLVAERMGINSIGCELNPAYVADIGVPRVKGDCPMFTEIEIIDG